MGNIQNCKGLNNITKVIEIKILRIPLQKVKGLAFSLGNKNFIVINESLPEEEKESIYEHELDNLLLPPLDRHKDQH